MASRKNSNSYLGIDIGFYNVKVVELANEQGRPKLITYGFTDLPPVLTGQELSEQTDRVVGIIKQILKKAQTTTKQVVAALPVSAIFNSVITLAIDPQAPAKELQAAIEREAAKVVPLPLSEMVLDWKPIEGRKTGSFLITAAPEKLVKQYLTIFKQVGLQLVSLETESFALVRSLVGADPSVVMVVDMGADNSNISLMRQGIPILNRSVATSGNLFTKTLAGQLGLETVAADRFKRDLSLASHQIPVATLEKLFGELVHDIEYVFSLYQQETGSADRPEKIILTGGSSLLPGLSKFIENQTKVRTFVGDPWARIIYPQDLKAVLDGIGPKMSVAVGLAMREIL